MAKMNYNRPQYNKAQLDYREVNNKLKDKFVSKKNHPPIKGVEEQKGDKVKMLFKNKSELYMIQQSEYPIGSGNEFMDVRIHYRQDDEWLPGKKGITIPYHKIDDIIALMRQVQEERG